MCKRDENIEKEKTKRLLGTDNNKIDQKGSKDGDESNGVDKESINDSDFKIYNIKHRKRE